MKLLEKCDKTTQSDGEFPKDVTRCCMGRKQRPRRLHNNRALGSERVELRYNE